MVLDTVSLTNGGTKTYLSCADTAKLVRQALKYAFPGVKFSVRSDSYAGGASIRVKWTDGPTVKDVDACVQPYSGSGFDGMQDLKYPKDHWLLPDGSVVLAKVHHNLDRFTPTPKPALDAVLVSFHADFVFTERATSKALMIKGAENALANYALGPDIPAGITADQLVEDTKRGPRWAEAYANKHTGNCWVSDVLGRATRVLRGDGTRTQDANGTDLLAALQAEEVG